jgi:branched-subunit amino acid aminotransferase/4-amino-4-deoxychorismate lyase
MLAYVNGEFVPADRACVPIQDRGFLLADGVFDCWRTYAGVNVRKIAERNLERLRQGINYLELPGDEIIKQVDDATSELVVRNREKIDAVGDVWVFTVVSRGIGSEGYDTGGHSIVSMCNPIPFARAASLDWYETGVHLISSMMVRNPFLPVDPRVKSISRLAYVRGQLKAVRAGAGNWVVLFDNEGYITEAVAAALCIVEGDTIVHAPSWKILPSIDLQVFCGVGVELGFEVKERPLTMFDFLNADEVYVLATPYGAYPVVDVDGAPVHRGDRVGPKIMREWVEYVGFDFMTQLHGAQAASQLP